jgi:hypothetical protein
MISIFLNAHLYGTWMAKIAYHSGDGRLTGGVAQSSSLGVLDSRTSGMPRNANCSKSLSRVSFSVGGASTIWRSRNCTWQKVQTVISLELNNLKLYLGKVCSQRYERGIQHFLLFLQFTQFISVELESVCAVAGRKMWFYLLCLNKKTSKHNIQIYAWCFAPLVAAVFV